MKLSEARRCMKRFGRDGIVVALGSYDEDEGVLLAALECGIEDIVSSYEGKYDSDEEFVREMFEGIVPGLDDLPHYVHIDWESTARDVMMDYVECDGYYFEA